MAPKQATKGQKQIYDENQSTIRFYVLISLGSVLVHFLVQYFLLSTSVTRTAWVLFFLSVIVQLSVVNFMRYMARASYSNDGRSISDAGIDLNMEHGLGEYCKDIILLSAIVQSLSMLHVYFWSLYLIIPAYALYLLWVNVLGPWFFAPGPETDEDGDKKRKKRERKVMKQH